MDRTFLIWPRQEFDWPPHYLYRSLNLLLMSCFRFVLISLIHSFIVCLDVLASAAREIERRKRNLSDDGAVNWNDGDTNIATGKERAIGLRHVLSLVSWGISQALRTASRCPHMPAWMQMVPCFVSAFCQNETIQKNRVKSPQEVKTFITKNIIF